MISEDHVCQHSHYNVGPSVEDGFLTGPGLNAMANHGYLSQIGVGSIEDFITGTQEAFGMGKLAQPVAILLVPS
jgi:hypothetical protein